MSVKIFTFELWNGNIYISTNFSCHQVIGSSRDVSIDTRCEYLEEHYLDDITHGICKCKLDSFKLFIDDLKNVKVARLSNIANQDKITDDILELISRPNEKDEFIIIIELDDKFKMSDFISTLFIHTYSNTFYNDNQKYWVYYDVINNMIV